MAKRPPLTLDKENPNLGSDRGRAMLRDSFEQFGGMRSGVAAADGVMLAGNKSLEAARAAGLPIVEIESDGRTFYVIRRTDLTSEDPKARAYKVADNQIGFESLEWDPNVIAGMVADGVPLASFFTDDELVSVGVEPPVTPPNEVDLDPPVPEPPKTPRTQPGDLWLMGAHRLLCGDSFNAEARSRLLDGQLADMVLQDPPYAIYGSSTGIGADIADDKMVRPFFEQVARASLASVAEFGHVYVCCDWRSWAALWDGAQRAGLSPKNCIVWDKGGAGLGSNYANTYELVGFFSRLPPAKAMKSSSRRGQRQVYGSNVMRYNRPTGEERQHNAAKPVEMFAQFIENSTDVGATVLDFFGGSGTVLLAALKTGRRALTMEIEPSWCDVIVMRWEAATGQKAERA